MRDNFKENLHLSNDSIQTADTSTSSSQGISLNSNTQEPKIIKEVYDYNFAEELRVISELLEEYNYIGMDTEFPGITITNENGEYPKNIPYHTWQFNFQFDINKDNFNEQSINLLKKSGIIDSIFEYVPHATFGRVTFGLDLTKSFLFINILRASVKFRLFENGKQLSYDICSYFGYDMSNKINYSTIMSWNGAPIEKPLLCTTGIYIQSLGKCLNPNASGIFYDPELISDLSKNKKVPSHNYLSWAIHGASLDELVLHFVEKREIIGLLYK